MEPDARPRRPASTSVAPTTSIDIKSTNVPACAIPAWTGGSIPGSSVMLPIDVVNEAVA